MMKVSLLLLLSINLYSTSVAGIQLYYKDKNDEYRPVPGDYIVSKSPEMTSDRSRVSKRSVETGTVFIDGSLQRKTIPEVFALYSATKDSAERRKMFAPEDRFSVGSCEITETITWPARCYGTRGGIHLCRSNARGIMEIRGMGSCNNNINVMDFFLNKRR